MKQKWGRIITAFIRDEKGSQMLEFILVFPLVWLLLVFSFDQFSILYNKQKALAAAYEAGRIAAVQPNYGLAVYHAKERGEAELREGVGVADQAIQIQIKGGGWKKGNHILSEATMSFYLLASGEKVELTESYYMMIENAEDKK
ncbi:MAG: pilus assembly protein TadE [Brevibacillus sp.]|nr:pilus assembly protein TadE [Brevibacillus sp.]